MGRPRLTYEVCLERARKYSTLKELTTNGTLYQLIHKNGWIDRIVKDVGLIRRTKNGLWSYESVLKVARGFKTLYGWRTNHSASYHWASRNGYIRAIKKELNLAEYCFNEKEFTYEECIKDAKKYNNIHEWRNNGKTFKFCRNKFWVEEISTRVGYKKGSRKKLWWYELT